VLDRPVFKPGDAASNEIFGCLKFESIPPVIACDKREAFAQESEATEAIPLAVCDVVWSSSQSLSSAGALRRPGGSQ
jgi:hypothetical protein